MSMYKIKRHKLLNLYYIHDQYSGPIQEEYEVVKEEDSFQAALMKLKDYQATKAPSFIGLFEDYYKFEHMKAVWGDPKGVQPSEGQLFFICLKEMYGRFRTLYHLCEVKSIQEPHVIYHNHAESKNDRMTFAQFQGLALIPNRDESFIRNWESKANMRYPRNLVATLTGPIRYKNVSIGKVSRDWDLSKAAVKQIQALGV